jgi:hypothetical protein
MSKITDKQIRELAEYLEGSSSSISVAMEVCGIKPDNDQEQMSVAVRVEQIGEIFSCDACGWWIENSEMLDPDTHNGEQICVQCGEHE